MKIVVALGGNALGNSPKEQLDLVKKTAKNIVDLVSEGHDVIISHGNGPQVGMINLAMEAATVHENAPEMPFAECGAMSQGYIGYHLQQALEKELAVRKVKKRCITVVTQVMVDAKDPAFQNPTKPIGSFYTKEQADKIKKEKGYVMKEDAGRGFRRVVASPKPIRIVERDSINYMVHNGIMVIACGGGGIPVIKEGYGYKGVDAVIDKDRTQRGDYYEKPTQYWFINCEPKQNMIFEAYTWNADKKKSIEKTNNKTERSLIAPEYANRFIREFILEEEIWKTK